MAAPANLLALQFKLWPYLIHADTLTVNRLSLVHRDPWLCTGRRASRRWRSPPDLTADQFDSTGAMRSAIRSSPWQTRQIQLVPRNNSVALFMSPNWRGYPLATTLIAMRMPT